MARKTQAEATALLKQAMRAVFLAPNGQMSNAQIMVMSAIAKQCAAGRSTACFDSNGRLDADATLVAVGRQDIWHWMNQLLGIPDQEVARLAAHDLRE